MVCIHCGAETKVVNSRLQRRNNQVWRRRQCTRCQAVFTTEERVLYEKSWRVKGRAGNLEPFSRDKLLLSLYRSCQHRPTALSDAGGLADTIIKKLGEQVQDGVVASRNLAQTVQVALNRFDKAASVHYQAFHRR